MALPMFTIIVRWLHILSACLAIGVPFFVRYVLTPAAAATLDAPAQQRLRDAINASWRMVVYLLITVFILTGLYNFFYVAQPQVAAWPADARAQYHALFGFKVLLAFFVFFVASALPGRSKALAFIRVNARAWQLAMILTLLVILMMSNTLRAMRDHPPQPTGRSAATAASLPASTQH